MESEILIAADGRSIVTDGLKWIMNPYDEFAIEAALRLKEKHGGTVSIVSSGPQRVIEVIRSALAMGADNGLLIDDPVLEGADMLGLARALAAATRKFSADLILCGSRAIDYDLVQRGISVAEFLGWPHLSMAVAVDSDGSFVTIDRLIEGGRVSLKANLPAVVTIAGSHSVWNPRYASLAGVLSAKRKILEILKLVDLGLNEPDIGAEAARIRLVSLEKPLKRDACKIIDEDLDTAGKAMALVRALHKEANVI